MIMNCIDNASNRFISKMKKYDAKRFIVREAINDSLLYPSPVLGRVKCPFPSLIIGGQLPNFRFFSVHFNLSAPPQFTKILEISTPSHLLPTPQKELTKKRQKKNQIVLVTGFQASLSQINRFLKAILPSKDQHPPFWLV